MTTAMHSDMDIQTIKELRGKITPGEWCEDYCYNAIRHVERNCDLACPAHEYSCKHFGRYDGSFIAQAPAMIDYLLGEVERLEKMSSINEISHMQDENLRLPSDDKYSDWNCAWRNALCQEQPKVRHLAACKFGENDGPDWIWIFQTEDLKWAWLKAGCDYTGWDCQSGGKWMGGYETPEEAIKAVDCYESDRANLLAQISGEKPYGLS